MDRTDASIHEQRNVLNSLSRSRWRYRELFLILAWRDVAMSYRRNIYYGL